MGRCTLRFVASGKRRGPFEKGVITVQRRAGEREGIRTRDSLEPKPHRALHDVANTPTAEKNATLRTCASGGAGKASILTIGIVRTVCLKLAELATKKRVEYCYTKDGTIVRIETESPTRWGCHHVCQ
jgi:hypothetical protein